MQSYLDTKHEQEQRLATSRYELLNKEDDEEGLTEAVQSTHNIHDHGNLESNLPRVSSLPLGKPRTQFWVLFLPLLLLPTLFGLYKTISAIREAKNSASLDEYYQAPYSAGTVKMPATSVFVPTQYSVVTGIFAQDDPTLSNDNNNALNSSFGLIDQSENRWRNLSSYIDTLNSKADNLTAYKLIYIARHGEGYHNVAEMTYGTSAWNCHWSELRTDGNITWGPDAALTPNGINQALSANSAWKQEIPDGVPLPQSLYSSPLQRSAKTLFRTWSDILLNNGTLPIFKEGFRETIGLHTCDQRSTKSILSTAYPNWLFEPSFSENDELWNALYQETAPQQALRTQQVLNEIFAMDPSTYIGITAHSGTINAFFTVVGHQMISIQTGGFVPVLVRAIGHPEVSMPVITGGQSATQPVCTAVPTSAINSLR